MHDMDRASPHLSEVPCFRDILPKSGPYEKASKTAESHVAVTVSAQHRHTDARHFVLQEDAGTAFVDDHNKPLQTYSSSFLPNVEHHLTSEWPAQLPPGLGAQAEQGDAFQYVRNIGMDPNDSSYEGMMQFPLGENSFASSDPTWTRPPFAHYREAFPMVHAYGVFDDPQGYPDFISRTMDVPLHSYQLWGDSLALMDNPPEVFGTEALSFLGQSMSCGGTHPPKDVDATVDLLDSSGSQAHEYWQSFPPQNVEANASTQGTPLENRPADDDMDDFSMFFDTSTPTKRLSPNLAAVLLGIPEDPGIANRNDELLFRYEIRSSPNNGG